MVICQNITDCAVLWYAGLLGIVTVFMMSGAPEATFEAN